MIHTQGFSQCLSAGIICLLVGGTFAAKSVFLVDNELEHRAEFSARSWHLDAASIQAEVGGVEKLAYNYIDRLTQLPDRKAWCGSSQEISLVLAKAKSLQLIEVTNLTPGKADIVVKLPHSQSIQPKKLQPKNLRLYINPVNPATNAAQSWCISG